MKLPNWIALLIGISLAVTVISVYQPEPTTKESPFTITQELSQKVPKTATLYSSPDCSCCHYYVQYLDKLGVDVTFIQQDNFTDIKEQKLIPTDMQSCHTVIIGDFFIEGHVPVEGINKLFNQLPDVDGISLPGMPSGSPGMGGDKINPLVIYSISAGTTNEFLTL